MFIVCDCLGGGSLESGAWSLERDGSGSLVAGAPNGVRQMDETSQTPGRLFPGFGWDRP